MWCAQLFFPTGDWGPLQRQTSHKYAQRIKFEWFSPKTFFFLLKPYKLVSTVKHVDWALKNLRQRTTTFLARLRILPFYYSKTSFHLKNKKLPWKITIWVSWLACININDQLEIAPLLWCYWAWTFRFLPLELCFYFHFVHNNDRIGLTGPVQRLLGNADLIYMM